MTDARYTADIVVLRQAPDGLELLVIKRKKDPFVGFWALPGRHVDPDETSLPAAVRELREETSIVLEPADLTEVGYFDDPDRDPRGRYITTAYIAVVTAEVAAGAAAGDDAAEVAWVPLTSNLRLAFDHERIVMAAMGTPVYALANNAT